jgi:hypothetical protein
VTELPMDLAICAGVLGGAVATAEFPAGPDISVLPSALYRTGGWEWLAPWSVKGTLPAQPGSSPRTQPQTA